MTLDELRALLTPERLDQVAAHNCGASDLALALASALTDALIERDALRAEVARLTGERDARPAITREDAALRSERFDLGLGAESMSDEMRRAEDRVDAALREHAKGGE